MLDQLNFRGILALVLAASTLSLASGCKPRDAASAALADQNGNPTASQGYWLEKAALDTVSKDGADAAAAATKLGEHTTKHSFLTVSERVNGYRDVQLMANVAIRNGLLLTDAAKSPDAAQQGSGRVYAPESDLVGVLESCNEIVNALKPVLPRDFWATEWTAAKSRAVSDAMKVVAAGFLRAGDEIRSWQTIEPAAVPPKPIPLPTPLDEARDRFHFVKGLEDDVVSGKFTGTVPSIQSLKAALQQDMAAPQAKRMGQRLIQALSGIDAVAKFYAEDAGVSEGYTVQEHTEMVLAVYFEQWKLMKFPQGRDYSLLLPITVALHDIGKPVAARTKDLAEELRRAKAWGQDKQLDQQVSMNGSQHIHNGLVASAVLQKLGFSDSDAKIAFALLNHDVLGHAAKEELSPEMALRELQRLAIEAGLPLTQYFDLLLPLYVADATSYDFVRQRFFVRESNGRLTTRNGVLRDIELLVRPAPPRPKPVAQPERRIEAKKKIPEKEASGPWSWFTSWF